MKLEFEVRFTKAYLLEAWLYIMKRQGHLNGCMIALVTGFLLYLFEHYLLHLHHRSVDLISFGIPAVSIATLGLYIRRFTIVGQDITKITLTDETFSVGFKRKPPIVIPWFKFEGYSTSPRLLCLQHDQKSRSPSGSYLAIPLLDITPEAFKFVKARLSPLPEKDYFGSQYESRLWGTIAHLSALSMYFTGVGFIAGPLIIWIWKRKSNHVNEEAREALNFNISILIYFIVAASLCVPYLLASSGVHAVPNGFVGGYVFLGIGSFILMILSFILILLIHTFQLICIFVAGVTTATGRSYRYPFNLRLVRKGSVEKPFGMAIALIICLFLMVGAFEIYWLNMRGAKASGHHTRAVDKNDADKVVTLTNSSISKPALGQKWTNDLGMRFNPIFGLNVLFGVWDVRVKDYEVFLHDADYHWFRPVFQQTQDEPAAGISWDDAKAFCEWLTQRDRQSGILSASQYYRLPTDAEWSVAAGGTKYPWGDRWPPPIGAGNYASSLHVDSYDYTSPVGSFPPNKYGLYDMGGNVWQWCEDSKDGKPFKDRRGGSYFDNAPGWLLSSFCMGSVPQAGGDTVGFRIVVVVNP